MKKKTLTLSFSEKKKNTRSLALSLLLSFLFPGAASVLRPHWNEREGRLCSTEKEELAKRGEERRKEKSLFFHSID